MLRALVSPALSCGLALSASAELEPASGARDPWDATRYHVYVGQYTATRYTQILQLKTDFQASSIAAAGLVRRLKPLGERAHLEGELHVGQHHGMQHHQELNGLISIRWRRFPWDDAVDTSFAFGKGQSLASRHPPLENHPDRPPAVRRQSYMLTEFEFSRPGGARAALFLRIHHRSGVYGLVSDSRGSNFICIGLRGSL